MWALYHKILDEKKNFQKKTFLSRSRVIFEKSCDFYQKTQKTLFLNQKWQK
jgi:hypothetical protein